MKNVEKMLKMMGIGDVTDYWHARPLLRLRLVNGKLEPGKVAGRPHIPYLDLEIIFYLEIARDQKGMDSIPVTDGMFFGWGVGLDQVYRDALVNTQMAAPATVEPMNDVLKKNLGFSMNDVLKGIPGFAPDWMSEMAGIGGMPDGPSLPDIGLHVVSNESGIFGAAAILYPGVLKKCSEMLGGNLCILPSSVHEVLICPMETADNAGDLAGMIQEINRNELKAGEVLSDHPYFYSASSGKVIMRPGNN